MRKTLEQRFFKKTVTHTEGCWEWAGAKVPAGYGSIGVKGIQTGAHRVSYELHIGEIPEGMVIDHLCRNRGCVNPTHLEVVTNKENILRGESPQAKNARKTHCKRGHELIEENLIRNKSTIKLGLRKCRECHNRHLSEKENGNGVYKRLC